MGKADVGYVMDLAIIEAVWESDPSASHEKQWTDAIEKSLTVKKE